jgi:flagellar assembly protein FliH
VSESAYYEPPSLTVPTTRELRRLSRASVVSTPYVSRREPVDAVGDERSVERRDGYREGFEDGCAQGRTLAVEEAAQTRAHDTARARTALDALAGAVRAAHEADLRMRAEIQAAAPKLAFALLEELMARELWLATNPGREAVARVLALDEGTQPATIRMNPRDIETLGDIDATLSTREVTLVADANVEPGGAVVDIGKGTLDGQLSTALERVRDVLLGSQRGDDDD